MKNYPLVSIITVVLNRKDTIEEAIKSVLGQSYENVEYIVVDGGSTDGTLEIIERYKSKIAKFISGKDKGIFDAMNKGLKMASGNIIGFLNGDDLYANEKVIEDVAALMERKNTDCLWGDLVYVDEKNTDKIIRYWKSSEYKRGKFQRGWMPPHPTFFVKKEIYENYGEFNLALSISADYEIMLRLLEKHKISSCYLPHILVKMRIGGQSNRNFFSILQGNLECYKSWKINGLRINPLRIFFKPLSKIPQYFKIKKVS